MKKLLAALAFLFASAGGLLHAEEGPTTRISLNPGFGMLIAGDKKATGGFAFTATFLFGMKFNEYFGISTENSLMLTTFRSLQTVGVVDVNALQFTFTPSKHVLFDFGPSLDLFSMILCSNESFCARETGAAPGLNLYMSFLTTDTFGVALNAHGAWLPGRYYSGPIFTTNVGPLWVF